MSLASWWRDRVWSFLRVVFARTFRGFLDARGWDLALSLAYSSLISFVPLIAAVSILTTTLFGRSGGDLYDIINKTLPGASKELVFDVQKAVAQARTLSSLATFFFVLTSLRTFVLVESASNALWGSTIHRRPLRLIGLGITVVILGPISLGVTTSLLLQAGVPFLSFTFFGLAITAVILTVLYKVIPASYVRWGPATVAGVFAAATIALLKSAFTRGIVSVTELSHIYGSITAIVIFVLAVGFVWDVLLLGFCLAHAIQFRDELLAHDVPEVVGLRGSPLDEAVRMLLRIAGERKTGATLSALSVEVGRPEDEARTHLEKLVGAGLVAVDGATYRLTRKPEQISLYTIARAMGEAIPRPIPAGDDPVADTLRHIYSRADREERGVLQGTSLRDLVKRTG